MILTCSTYPFLGCPDLRRHTLAVLWQAAILSLNGIRIFQRRHSIRRLALLFVAGLGFAHVSSASAATIYSQTMPADPHAAFASHSAFDPPQILADNFSFDSPGSVTVRSLRVVGGTGLVESLIDDFRVVFLSDAGGMPGAPLTGGDFSIGPAFSRSPTGGPLLNGVTTPIEYAINLPSGMSLQPNTSYWLSVSNDPSPLSGWGWARANGVIDQSTASTNGSIEAGSWNTFANGGMWFELNDHNIPEPSTRAILTSLIALCFASRPRCFSGLDLTLAR